MFETDIDRIVEQHDSDYINGTRHMFWTPFDEWQDDVDDDEDELTTVAVYDVNGKPFYMDIKAKEFAELNAEDDFYNWVKPTRIIGNRMYKGDRLITLEETRKHA